MRSNSRRWLCALATTAVALAGCPGDQIPTGRDAAVRDARRDSGELPDDGLIEEDVVEADDPTPPIDEGAPDASEAAVTPDAPPSGGCRSNTECNDDDVCTENVCDVETGTCTFRSIAECCTEASMCDDDDACTDDTCDMSANRCVRRLRAGCCTTDDDCNDDDACTRDTCNTATNRCSTAPVEGCCTEGMTRMCYTGAAGTMGRGQCRGGMQTCVGNRWPDACEGEVLPASSETCDTARVDEDCDGMVNEDCTCTNGMTRSCYTGPSGTSGVGRCRGGMQTCSGGMWGACTGQTLPAASDTCGNMVDEDCDGSDAACPPANDTRARAIDIPVRVAESVVTGTTVGATHDGPTVDCTCTSGGNVWYRFTLPADSTVYLDTSNATAGLDTSLFLTDAMGTLVPAQSSNGQDKPGLCNDDSGCGGVAGWGSAFQSRTWGFLRAGTYYVAVGGCGAGAFTLRLQHIPVTEGSYFYNTRISGDSSDTTVLVGMNRHATTCGGATISGEDVRWFISCGAATQFFSLCEQDGGGYLSRNATSESTRWDPVLYMHSGITGHESRCSDMGTAGVDCRGRVGTSLSAATLDTVQGAPRLNNITADRGVNAVLVDERARGSGMWYRLRYRLRDR